MTGIRKAPRLDACAEGYSFCNPSKRPPAQIGTGEPNSLATSVGKRYFGTGQI